MDSLLCYQLFKAAGIKKFDYVPFSGGGEAMIALLGGLTLPLYSVCMAHMNDYLKPGQMVAASGTLVLILASGMVIGPTLGAFVIEFYGPNGLYYLLSIISALTVTTAFFRLWVGQPVVEHPTLAVALPANLTPEAANLYPDACHRD